MRCVVVSLVAILLGVCSHLASAVEPALNAIQPQGFQRGTELKVQFAGARLADAQELLFYSPGLTVKAIEPVNDNAFAATLAVAPDCRLGIHAVRVRTATGVSNLRTFCVGALPEVKEVEPNSDFAAPQAIPFGCVMSGVVDNEDVDHYVVDAKKGDRITAELEGLRLGNTFFDPYLAILNAARFELARSDDAPLLRQDCLCSVVAPEDGKYIVQVRESSFGGNGGCTYRLHVGTFPRPTAVIPAGGKPGETIEVRWIGDSKGVWTEKITLPTLETPEHGLYSQDSGGIAPSPNLVRVVNLDNAIEVEPNDQLAEATQATAPGALNGIIDRPGDIDGFKFAAKKGQVFDIRIYARTTLRSPLDSTLTILRSNGAGVASNDDSGGPDSYLRFTAPDDDNYIAVISDHLKAGGPNFAYRCEIAPVQASLTMSLPERVQYIPTTLTVPRGNRMALMVTANRVNFGGDLNMAFEGLPAGVTVQAAPITANQTTVPVLLTVPAEAPLGGALADIVAKPTDPNLSSIVGHFRQRAMLIRGQNNIDVWGHDAQRMALVVSEKLPFSIDIVQPKVPIVRDGTMSLKVVATRAEGFTAPIAISLLYNPPGIASSGSISIPEGQSEAVIPVTANSGPSFGTWPLIAIGRAAHLGGTVESSSQMAQLVVAERFFDLAFQKAAAELGQEAELVVNITKKSDFEGEAKIELLGLPANTSLPPEPMPFTKDSADVAFKIKIDPMARPGSYKTLVCRATVMQNGEPITTTLGTGELRIDQPLPPKPAVVAKPVVQAVPQPTPPPMPQPVAAAPPKRLTRLEQLRLQREQEKK